MKISMWILADLLKDKKYDMDIHIENGERCIQNVRLLSDSTKLSCDSFISSPSDNCCMSEGATAYIYQPAEDKIACINGKDNINIKCGNPEKLLNDILDIFEYCNEWSGNIQKKILEGCTEKDLLQSFSSFTRFYYILSDATFYIYEQYGDTEIQSQNKQVARHFEEHLMPLENILRINQKTNIRLANQPAYTVSLPESISCVKNLFSQNVHQGWLVALNTKNKFTKGQMQLHDYMGEIVEQFMKKTVYSIKRYEKSGILLEILDDSIKEKTMVLHRLSGFSWHEDDPKTMYVIKPFQNESTVLYALQRHLEFLAGNSFVLLYQEKLLVLINLSITSGEQFESLLLHHLKQTGCIAGKSPVFTDIFLLKQNVHAAEISINYAKTDAKKIYHLEDSILPYIQHLLTENSLIELRHPALQTLKDYDAIHKTELYKTLFAFLKLGLSYNRTAEELHIHRTTLNYREERICDITGIDLNNDDERMHLLISFLADNAWK